MSQQAGTATLVRHWPDTGISSSGQWRNPWLLGALAAALLVALPVISILLLALAPEENIWPHLSATVLPGYLRTTLFLLLGVGVGTLILGVATAWLVTMCRFPGRTLFEWALLLPFAVPAYVIAYTYTDLLEYAGLVQSTLRAWFGWQSKADYWFPEIRSLGGAISMMTLVMYPYVYMLARAAFMEQSPYMLDAARVLGHNAWSSFFRISLPLARPAIAVGLALVLMEVMNDFGTVDYFAVRNLTAGLYDVWLGMGNLGGGAQIASVMLIFVAILIMLERLGRRRQAHYQGNRRFQRLPGYTLRGWRATLALLVCMLPLVLGFLVPAGVLLWYAVGYFEQSWTAEFRTYAWNSIMLSFTAAVLALLIGIFLAYSRRLNNNRWLTGAVRLAGLGYAMPGAVLAIGVMIPLSRFDNTIDGWMRDLFGISTGLLLSGTVFAILFAYVVRFLAVALGAVESSLAKVTPSMDMASRSLGHGPMFTLRRVHLPLIRGGLLTAALVVFVDCMKELPATLVLRPFNFDTLATHVYQFASDELLEQSALAALLIVLVGLLPVIGLSYSISRSRELK